MPSCSLRAVCPHYTRGSGIWDLAAAVLFEPTGSRTMLRRLPSAPSIPARARLQRFSSTAKEKVVDMGDVMWSPSQGRVASSRMLAFARLAGERSGRDLRRCGLERWECMPPCVSPHCTAVSVLTAKTDSSASILNGMLMLTSTGSIVMLLLYSYEE